MKLGPVPKIDKRHMAKSKKINNDVMSASCDVIVFLPIYGQFPAIRKPDSRRMVYETYILQNVKTELEKSLTQLYPIALSKGNIFAKNC